MRKPLTLTRKYIRECPSYECTAVQNTVHVASFFSVAVLPVVSVVVLALAFGL